MRGGVRVDAVGVAKGEPLVINDCFSGDLFGDGGGVGVTVFSCFSATDSSTCTITERMVGTCWCMRLESSSLRVVVMRSLRGQPSSSDVMMRKDRPRGVVSLLRTSCGDNQEYWGGPYL